VKRLRYSRISEGDPSTSTRTITGMLAKEYCGSAD
jgi:hypothetical protein